MAACAERKRLVSQRAGVVSTVRTFSLSLLLSFSLLPVRLHAQSAPITVMTFNIRYGTANDGAHAWPARRAHVISTITAHAPDLLGVQEALDFQVKELQGALPTHERFGVGRDDGKTAGEYAPVFVDTTRFRVHQSGTTWLSDTPEVPGSRSWGNTIPRIATWVLIEERRTGDRFYLFNLHLDHQSQESRERSVAFVLSEYQRRRSALIAREAQDAEFGGAAPSPRLLLVGDFNADESNPAYRVAIDRGLVSAFRAMHPDTDTVATFNAFAADYDPTGGMIDHILLGGDWRVQRAGIDRTRFGGLWASDHFAVWAVVE